MDSIHLVEYMAWVPIVGSAFGNVLGGFVSDYVIGKQRAAEDDASASLLTAVGDPAELLLPAETSSAAVSSQEVLEASGLSKVGVISSAGDLRRRSAKDPSDQSVRMLIAGWSNLLPIPLIILSLLSPFPYCFLIMIASGMVRTVHRQKQPCSSSLSLMIDSALICPVLYFAPFRWERCIWGRLSPP
jgi:hypothetical protein